jgi:hypothetical protein
MSIFVEVRNERGEILADMPGFQFQSLVAWECRASFPMLAFIDPFGNTVFNAGQAEALDEELAGILDRCANEGVLATACSIGADQTHKDSAIIGWDLERDFVSLVERLRAACAVVLERPHRYVWFSGD